MFLLYFFSFNLYMSYSERIKQLVEFEGSQAKFSKKVGLSPQSINRIINQGSGVNGDTILAIAEAYPKLSIEWFVTGEGKMWKAHVGEIPESREDRIIDSEKEEMMREMIELQKARIKELTRTILEKAPELAKYLDIEEE